MTMLLLFCQLVGSVCGMAHLQQEQLQVQQGEQESWTSCCCGCTTESTQTDAICSRQLPLPTMLLSFAFVLL